MFYNISIIRFGALILLKLTKNFIENFIILFFNIYIFLKKKIKNENFILKKGFPKYMLKINFSNNFLDLY